MPLYEYICEECRRKQELLVRGGEQPHCETCGSERLAKLLSVPTAHSTGSDAGDSQGRPDGPCGPSCGCFPSGL